jgi:hypothetical protein
MAQRWVWFAGVVVMSPLLDNDLCIHQAVEDDKTLVELSEQFDVHANQITQIT